jgi:HEPN domain-containing protein
MTDEVMAWVTYAEEDWQYGVQGLESFPRPASWSLQQAAEKYIKAVLLQQGKDPPRTHDLIFLLNLVSVKYPQELHSAAAELNALGPTQRYPGDMPTITQDDVARAKVAAKLIRDWVRQHLSL